MLVAHFVRRLLAGDEESDSDVSLGLGAVLAILASPGAFASIFLLDKYSSLLQWFRHQAFNSYKASVADEYFFVVLSMTITGLAMVLRWNRLFPDRRDFDNLAALPIPIRNVFFANFIALFGLAVLFAVDVNAFSSVFFPLIVTISDGQGGSFSQLVLMLRSHAATVFLSSLFSFFAVFGFVGLLMLTVPKRLFQPVSLCVRILLVVALMTEFFANMFLQLFSGHLSAGANEYARLLPPFWFLGIYESLAHLSTPAMQALSERALSATAGAALISLGCYTLCYRRRFLRLAESVDMVGAPGNRHIFRIPGWCSRVLFRAPFERAGAAFMLRVLLRSERHLLFLGGYLGIGLVLTAQTAMDGVSRWPAHSAVPNSDLLAVPLMVAFVIITGLRFVFDKPAGLNANWVFRTILENPSPNPSRAVRKVLLLSVIPWQLLLLFPASGIQFGWRFAVAHTLTVLILSVTLIEFLVVRFRKIPFTYSSRPDIRMLLLRILGTLFAVMILVPVIATIERGMLLAPVRFVYGAVLLAGIWAWILRSWRDVSQTQNSLAFEDAAAPTFELLKLV